MDQDEQWSVAGDYLEACSCDAGCPCKFGATPTQGYCHGALAFQIKDGSYGTVDLGGLGMVLLMKAPGAPWLGDLTVTSYVDEQASPEQRESLGAILSGEAGGFWAIIASFVSDNRGVKFGSLQMETDGKRRTVSVPDVIDLVNEPLINPITEQEQEVMVTNSIDPFCVSGRAGRSVKAVVKDPDISFDLSGQQGYIGTFSWAGP